MNRPRRLSRVRREVIITRSGGLGTGLELVKLLPVGMTCMYLLDVAANVQIHM